MNTYILLLVLKNGFFGGIASLGFAILFNAPKKALLGCALSGALGICVRSILLESGIGIELSTFCGALSVGFLSLYFYKLFFIPTAVFGVSGAIPMIPGVFAFKAMMGVIALSNHGGNVDLMVDVFSNFTKTALILIAIATGITAPTLLFKRFRMVM